MPVARALHPHARQLLEHERFEDSRRVYDQILAHAPDDEEALYGLGLAAFMLNDIVAARASFNRVLARPPGPACFQFICLPRTWRGTMALWRTQYSITGSA